MYNLFFNVVSLKKVVKQLAFWSRKKRYSLLAPFYNLLSFMFQ